MYYFGLMVYSIQLKIDRLLLHIHCLKISTAFKNVETSSQPHIVTIELKGGVMKRILIQRIFPRKAVITEIMSFYKVLRNEWLHGCKN